MNRLKLLIFALPLALWAASFVLSSELVLGPAEQQGQALAARAADAVGARVGARREELLQLGLKALTQPEVMTALQAARLGRTEALAPEKYAAVRDAIFTVVPEALQAHMVVGLSTASGAALFARGPAEGAEALPGFEPAALLQAGVQGVVKDGLKEPYLFFSFPAGPSQEKPAEGKSAPVLVLGEPLLAKGVADEVAAELPADAVGLFSGDALLQQAGAEKGRLADSRKVALPGKNGVLRTGPLATLGPVALPFAQGKDVAHLVVARRPVAASPLEVVSIVSVQPLLGKLAEGQRSTLICFLGALGIFLFGLIVMGGGRGASESTDDASEESPEDRAEEAVGRSTSPGMAAAAESTAPSAAPASLEPAAAVTSPPSSEEAAEGVEDPFASFGAPSKSPAAAPASGNGLDFGGGYYSPPPVADEAMPPPAPTDAPLEDHQPTMAYQIAPPPEAFAHGEGETPYNPDATRVAAIPSELLRASARPATSDELTAVAVPSRATSTGATPEQVHFQEVFRDFVSTRERCGEPADGLTFDKFAAKLKKNRDQLVQKYNCRSVKFQVYVKDGKAALKATPVKD